MQNSSQYKEKNTFSSPFFCPWGCLICPYNNSKLAHQLLLQLNFLLLELHFTFCLSFSHSSSLPCCILSSWASWNETCLYRTCAKSFHYIFIQLGPEDFITFPFSLSLVPSWFLSQLVLRPSDSSGSRVTGSKILRNVFSIFVIVLLTSFDGFLSSFDAFFVFFFLFLRSSSLSLSLSLEEEEEELEELELESPPLI